MNCLRVDYNECLLLMEDGNKFCYLLIYEFFFFVVRFIIIFVSNDWDFCLV